MQKTMEGKFMNRAKRLIATLIIAALLTSAVEWRYKALAQEEVKLESVTVKLHTLDDDKDKEEAIDLKIKYIDTVYASASVGGGELWKDHSPREFEMEIKPALSLGKAQRAYLTLYKHPHGSETGCGWNAKIEVVGHLSDGRDVDLVSTGGMRIGDNNAYDLKFNFKKIQ
jgi:hypothetical protein